MNSDSTENPAEIDWGVLEERLGADTIVSSRHAQLALAEVIGPERLRASVDWYIAQRRGHGLAHSVLKQVKPPAARDRCVELWITSDQPEVRRSAVELLRVIATSDDLHLIPEFLKDADPLVQTWGIGVLDQILLDGLVDPADITSILQIAESHSNPHVRERAESIREYTTAG